MLWSQGICMWKNGFFHPCSPAKTNGSARSTRRLTVTPKKQCHAQKTFMEKCWTLWLPSLCEHLVESEKKTRGDSLHFPPSVFNAVSKRASPSCGLGLVFSFASRLYHISSAVGLCQFLPVCLLPPSLSHLVTWISPLRRQIFCYGLIWPLA